MGLFFCSIFGVAEDVHEVHEGFVGAGVGGEVGVDVAVVPIFGTHGVDVVRSGKVTPVRNEVGVVRCEDFIADVV